MLRVAAATAALAILLVDVLSPLEGAVAVLYVVVVLIAARAGRRADVYAATGVGLAFTMLAYVSSHGLEHVGSSSLRALVSLAAIVITALLSLRNIGTTERLAATAQLIDISHDMIFMRDRAGDITFWNRAAEQVYGWSAEEAIGQPADALLSARYAMPRARIEAVLAETGRWEGTIGHRTRAGTEIVVESRWAPRTDAFGQTLGVLETNTDVTARHAAHAALVQSERRYRRMFDGGRVGIVEEDWTEVRAEFARLGIRDAAGLGTALAADPGLLTRARRAARIVRVNPAFRVMIGLPEVTDATVDDILGEDDTSFAAVLGAFVGGERSLEGETEIARCDGSRLPVMFGINFPAPDDAGAEVFVFVVDLTERRQAQDALLLARTELAHAARVATLGEISASIAHEVNQPLMAVVTNGEAALRWLRRPEPDLGEVEAGLTRIVSEGRRAGEIVTRIRGFLRKAPLAREPLGVADLVEEAHRLVSHELARAGVRVDRTIAPGLPVVVGDRIALQQVLVNLMLNAAQAMGAVEGSRRLAIRAAAVGEGVEITVADTGPGLSDIELERLFAPFFTTKAEGMGMGLAIARSTAEAHGGRLIAESTPGAGATFRLSLPAQLTEITA
jgi:PAS domain S-box-containing protein